MPLYSIFFFLFIISNVSIPLTSGFPGELLIMIGILKNALIYSIIILLTIIITTGYNFNLMNKFIFGNISKSILKYRDISRLEF
jgi:NADH-quinone oxidoreductase subunit M